MGLRCSALATGQLATGGTRGQGKAVSDPQTGGVGGLRACEGQQGAAGVDGQSIAGFEALTRICRTVRSWALHHHSDKSLQDLAVMHNPCIRGWITYYSHFYKTQLRPTLKRIDAYVIRWARRKFKRMRHQTKGEEIGLTGSAAPTPRSSPTGSYAMATAEHREPCDSRGSCTVLGAPGVKVPRATRQQHVCASGCRRGRPTPGS